MIKELLLIVTMAFAFVSTTMADAFGYTKESPLLFGIDMDYAPLEFVDTEGRPHGYDIEFTEELMQRLGIPFIYKPNTWQNIAGDVLQGRVDLGMMVFSPYRKDSTNYSKAVFRLYYQIIFRKEDSEQRFDVRNLSGKTVAYMSSRPVTDTLKKVGADIVIIEDLARAFRELSGGKYDAVICFRYQTKFFIETYGLENLKAEDLTLAPREYCYVSHNKQLIEAINRELDLMEQEGIMQRIYGSNILSFGSSFFIPQWVWYLLGAILLSALVAIIIVQQLYQRRLRQEMERAQRSEHMKTIFLGNVSHALRTPLNSVIGFSDMLRHDEGMLLEDERQEMLTLINQNGQQLLHFIEELLELSNIEGKNQLFNRSVVNLKEAMESFANEVRPELHKGVQLSVKGDGGQVTLDANLLRYVVIHLLNNAVEHTYQGSVTLSYGKHKNGLFVQVSDTGEGLPADLKENIFSLLSEKQTYVQEKVPGLGLSICKAIVERTGGRLRAESPKEGGTVMWLWVPRTITNKRK